MRTEIKLPKMGLTMEEATIATWEKNIGDIVEAGEAIVTVETDKAVMDIEATASGYLIEQLVKPGDVIAVGGILGYLANEVEAGVAPQERIRISPAARKLAKSKGIDLYQIRGTGPIGRIMLRDIIDKPDQNRESTNKRFTPSNTVSHKPLSMMRKVIAERLSYSFREIPQFQVKNRADMTNVIKIRETLVNSVEQTAGIRLSVLDFIIQAVARALAHVPKVNASFRTDSADSYILQHQEINIGLAVSVPDGLVVPVIQNADKLSLLEIAKRRHELVSGARLGKLTSEDTKGGTFTISSLASFDVDEFVALINPPEAGILAIGRAKKIPVAVGDSIELATILKMNGSFDHRPMDGADGAEFMQFLAKQLESDRWTIV